MLGTAAGSGIHKEVRGILPKGLNDPRTPVRLGEVGLNAQGAASIHRKRPRNQDQRSRGQRTHTHRTETLLPEAESGALPRYEPWFETGRRTNHSTQPPCGWAEFKTALCYYLE